MTVDERAMARAIRSLKPSASYTSISRKIGKEFRGGHRNGPSKSNLSRMFQGQSWQNPQRPNKPGQGRPPNVLPKDLKRLPKVLEKLQEKAAHKDSSGAQVEVPAHVVLEHWKPTLKPGQKEPTAAYVSAKLRELGYCWQPFPAALPIGDTQAAVRGAEQRENTPDARALESIPTGMVSKALASGVFRSPFVLRLAVGSLTERLLLLALRGQ
jgi:hypothetical protein